MTPAAWLPHPFLEGPPTPPTKLERNNSTISRVGGDSSYVRCSKGHPFSHSNHTLDDLHHLILSQASAMASLCPRMTAATCDGGGVRASGGGCERRGVRGYVSFTGYKYMYAISPFFNQIFFFFMMRGQGRAYIIHSRLVRIKPVSRSKGAGCSKVIYIPDHFHHTDCAGM